MRVVVDTNVVISALYFGGKPDIILQAIKERRIEICINQDILQEYHDTSVILA